MALGPGAYEVEVGAAGYETVRETVEHGTDDRAAGGVSGPAATAVHGRDGAGGGTDTDSEH